MACDILAGRAGKICKDKLGGNSSLYIFNFVANPFTVVAGEATAIDAALTTVFEFGLEGDGNTLVQDKTSDRNTGTSVNTTTLVAVLKALDAPTNVTLNLLSAGYPQAVVKDRNGNYHAIGLDDGIDFAINSQTGGVKTDLNGYTITGVSTTQALAPILDATTVTAFLALVA